MKVFWIVIYVLVTVLGSIEFIHCIELKNYRESIAWAYIVLRIAIDMYANIQNAKLDKEREKLLKTLL